MKVTVFGATGGAGRQVVAQALEKGYAVRAFTRSPHKLTPEDGKLTVFEGDILDADRVSAAIAGADAVVSTLGPTDNKAEFVVSRGMENILAGMKAHGVSRLVATAGAGVKDANDDPKFINTLMNRILRILSSNVYADMVRMVGIIRESDVDWTVVRVPRLTDGPKRGEVTAAWVGKGMGMQLTRADLASFVLDQLEDNAYLHQAPAVSN